MFSLGVVMWALVVCSLGAEQSYEPLTEPPNYQGSSNQFKRWDPSAQGGIQVQTGYEGYLLPAPLSGDVTSLSQAGGFLGLTKWDIISSLIAPVPAILLKFAFKLGFYVLGISTLFAVGIAATSAICTLTPFCSISFKGFHLNSEVVKDYVTEERVQRAAKFLFDSLDKYSKLNKKPKRKTKPASVDGQGGNDLKSVIKQR